MKKKIPFTKEIPFKTMISEITDINLEHDLEILDTTIEGNFIVSGKYKMTDASVIEEEFLHRIPFTIEMDDRYDLSKSKLSINDFYFEIINEEILKVNIEVLLDDYFEKELEIIEATDDRGLIDKIEVNSINNNNDNEVLLLDEADASLLKTNSDSNVNSYSDNVSNVMKLENQKSVDNNIIDTNYVVNNIDNSSKVEAVDSSIKTSDNSNGDSEGSVTSIFASSFNDETFSTYHVYIVRENDTLDSILDRYKVLKEDVSNYNDLNDIKVGSKLIIPCSNE